MHPPPLRPIPTPARDAEGASAVIAATLNVSRDGADVAAAVELFAADLRSSGGLASTLIPSPARISVARNAAAAAASPRRPTTSTASPGRRVGAPRLSALLKRVRSPRPTNTPRPKRRGIAISPRRSGTRAMARVAATIASASLVAPPPAILRSRTTPAFDPTASLPPPPAARSATKKKYAMLGLTSKSAFLDFLRGATMGSGVVSPATVKRDTARYRWEGGRVGFRIFRNVSLQRIETRTVPQGYR